MKDSGYGYVVGYNGETVPVDRELEWLRMGTPGRGGGGLPFWPFHGNPPSPTYPTNTTNPTPSAPYEAPPVYTPPGTRPPTVNWPSGTAPTRNPIVTGLGKIPASKWLDIGSGVGGAALTYLGQRGANNATDRAAELQAQGNAAILAQEKDNETRRRLEWDEQQKVAARNAAIEEEARMEDLRRLEEREQQEEPRRLARENAYRAYMQRYWGIDVGPSVARTPRNIVAGGTTVLPLSSTASASSSSSTTPSRQAVPVGSTTALPVPQTPVQQPAPYVSPFQVSPDGYRRTRLSDRSAY